MSAGIEPTDWHTHVAWQPNGIPHTLDFSQLLHGLIASCETVCVTACCGLDAYEVRADSLFAWARRHGDHFGLTAALTQLEAALTILGTVQGAVRGHDTLLYHQWDEATDCIAYFAEWRREGCRALAAVGGREVLRPEWLTTTVRAIAAGVVADRDFSRLPVLADALEDAGCESELLLTHLRANGPHGWFCWAVDLLADG